MGVRQSSQLVIQTHELNAGRQEFMDGVSDE